jgi:putative ABC transport system permease protein
MFAEVTDANEESFHFHGDEGEFPVHAAIVVPQDRKAEAILLGRYQKSQSVQMIRPVEVLESLLAALFRVEKLVIGALVLVAAASLLVVALVFGLSFKLRAREFASLADLGVGQVTLWLAKLAEVLMIGIVAGGVAWAGRELAIAMAQSVLSKGFGG